MTAAVIILFGVKRREHMQRPELNLNTAYEKH